MAKTKRLIEIEGARNKAELAAFLHHLADWMDEGKLVLGEGEEAQVLVLPDELVLEFQVEAKKKRKGKKYSLEIEMEWVEIGVEKNETPQEASAVSKPGSTTDQAA